MVKPKQSAEISLENTELLEEEVDQTEQSILAEMNATEDDVTWTYSVSRVVGAAKSGVKEPFLFEGDAIEITGLKVRLRDECGTGTYRVRVYRNKVLYRRFDLSVEAPLKQPEKNSSDMSAVMAAIQSSHDKTMQVMERLMERQAQPSQPAFDPVAMFAGIGTIMANFQKMIPAPPPPPTAPEKAASAESPAKMMKEVMDLFRQGVDFAQTINPPERSGGMTGIVERLLDSPLLAKLAEGVQAPATPQPLTLPPPRQPGAQPPLAAPRPVAQPQPFAQPNPTPAAPTAPQAVLDENFEPEQDSASITEIAPSIKPTPQEMLTAIQSNPQVQQQISQAIQYLVTRAERGSDAGYYAEWVLDNWPEELIDLMISTPDIVSMLEPFVEGLTAQRRWFTELVDACREMVEDDIRQANGGDTNAPSRTDAAVNVDGNTGREIRSGSNAGPDGQAGEGGQN